MSDVPTDSKFRRLAVVWPGALLTGSRVVSALVVNKIIAMVLGPGGLALVGQFQNFTAMAFGVTSGGLTNAVVATVAAGSDAEQRARAVGTAVASAAGGAALVAVVVILYARPLAGMVLGSASLDLVMIVFAATMLPVTLNVVLLAAMAGLGHSSSFILINVVIAAVSMPACWLLVVQHGISGALLSATVVNGAATLLTLAWLRRGRLFPMEWIGRGVDRGALTQLARLAGASLSTVVVIPIAQLLLRARVIESHGIDVAGQWQAALKIGEVLIMLASLMVSLHYLPRFARSGSGAGPSLQAAAVSVGIVLACAACLAVLSSGWVLPMLFSAEFSDAANLLPAQLLGDTLRGSTLVLQAGFLARSRVGAFAVVDLTYSTVLVVAGYGLVARFSATGAALAALVAGVAGFLLAIWLTRRVRRLGSDPGHAG